MPAPQHHRVTRQVRSLLVAAAAMPTLLVALYALVPDQGLSPAAAPGPHRESETHRDLAAEAVAGAEATIGRLSGGLPPDTVSIAAQNLTTGRRYGHQPTTPVRTGSVIKLNILEALLLQKQDDDRSLTDTEAQQATAMIESSDNDSATALWNEIGGADGIREANRRLGAAGTNPDDSGYWGLSTTSGDDQLALLRALVTPSALTPKSQSFALGLMRQVQTDQTWGVGAIADPGTPSALKDGWLNIDDDNQLWAVNSVGIVTVGGQQVLMVVLTQHNPSQPDGIKFAESLARATAPAIAPPPG